MRWKNRRENEFPSELGNDGNGKGYIIYFSHWNNYGINLFFHCDSPINPLYHNEFDVLYSLGKKLDFLTSKTGFPIISTDAISSQRHTCVSLPLVRADQVIWRAAKPPNVLLSVSDVTLMPVHLPCDWQWPLQSPNTAGGEKAISWFTLWLMCCCNL